MSTPNQEPNPDNPETPSQPLLSIQPNIEEEILDFLQKIPLETLDGILAKTEDLEERKHLLAAAMAEHAKSSAKVAR